MKKTLTALTLGLVLVAGTSVFAQDAAAPAADKPVASKTVNNKKHVKVVAKGDKKTTATTTTKTTTEAKADVAAPVEAKKVEKKKHAKKVSKKVEAKTEVKTEAAPKAN